MKLDPLSKSSSKKSSGTETKTVAEQKTTSEDEEKRYRFLKRLTSLSAEMFRELDINEYDLNFTEHFEELEYIDDTVTPLIYCAHYGLKEICRFLLRNREVDVDMETESNKQTPLIVACMNGNYEITRLLLLAGAEVNKPNSLNHNALTAVLFRLVEEEYSFENKKICFLIADLLISHGADVNWIVDKSKGFSLLHYFCASKMKMNKTQKTVNEDIIKFLLKNGASVSQKTLKDQVCGDLIEKHANRERVAKLIEEAAIQQSAEKAKMPLKQRKRLSEDEFFKITVPTSKVEENNNENDSKPPEHLTKNEQLGGDR